MRQEVPLHQMYAAVEDYIYNRKKVRVKINIEKGLGRNRWAADYLKDQLIKLNLAYNETQK